LKEEFVEINGEKIYFYVQRKKVKNLNLKVNADQKVIISIPMRMPIETAKNFIKKKIKWIKKQQEFYKKIPQKKESKEFKNGEKVYLLGKEYELKIKKDKINNINITNQNIELLIKEKYINNEEYIKKTYDKWLREYALNIFKKRVQEYQEKLSNYGIKNPNIEVRKTKAIWGSCTPMRNKVTFNLNLIKTPMYCIEYVVLHELAHFEYQNHSKNFYKFVEKFMPDWKKRKKILDEEFMLIGRK